MPRLSTAAILAALTATSLTTATATAQPRPRPRVTFADTTTFQSCQTTWMFACMIPDGRGGHHGTATPREQCTRYTFRPDGAVIIAGDLAADRATYRIDGDQVRLSMPDGQGGFVRWDLRLSADGAALGDMKRI